MAYLFAGGSHYARGGFNDFIGAFFSLPDALAAVEAEKASKKYSDWDWWHIIDSESLEVLASSAYQAYGCDGDSQYVHERED
jgi:hypothetical protein